MSDQSGSDGFKFPWQALLGIIALINVLWPGKPVTTSRPEPERFDDSVPARVRARLWEDPIDAMAAMKNSSTTTTSLIDLHSVSAAEFHGIAVMVSGRPYAHAAESRIRSRVAVHHALAASGFVPMSEDFLSFVLVSNETTQSIGSIPYELFKPAVAGPAQNAVAVLWIQDDFISGTNPVRKFSGLVSAIAPASTNWRWTLVGPRYSTMLPALYNAATNVGQPSSWSASTNLLEVLSPFATMDDYTIQALAGVANPITTNARSRTLITETAAAANKKCGFTFRQIGAQDDELAQKIIEEMVARGTTFSAERSPHIILCSEQDSPYARALPETFMRQFRNGFTVSNVVPSSHLLDFDGKLRRLMTKSRSTNCASSQAFGIPVNLEWKSSGPVTDVHIHTINFFAGLDGAIGGEKKHESSDAEGALEKPEGRAQADYIFRQAEDLKRQIADSFTQQVKAVCMFSGDVYDKLVALQVLKKVWPDATYYTMDADARYLSAENNRYARNLVIASAMGLQPSGPPGRAADGRTPPVFRDTYQSALYGAVSLALSPATHANAFQDAQLFEVGRKNLVKLETSDCTNWMGCLLSATGRDVGSRPYGIWLSIFSFLLVFAVFLFVLQRRPVKLQEGQRYTVGNRLLHWLRRKSAHRTASRLFYLLVIGYFLQFFFYDKNLIPIFLVSAALVLTLIERRPLAYALTFLFFAFLAFSRLSSTVASVVAGVKSYDAEPWSLDEGISIWPAVITRTIAGVLCIMVLLRESTIRFLRRRVWDAIPKPWSFKQLVLGIIPLSWSSDIEYSNTNSLRTAYFNHAGFTHRLIRILILALVYAIMMKAIFGLWGMSQLSTPARGPAALAAMRWAFVFSQYALFLLMAYIVDERKLLIDYSYMLISNLRQLPRPERKTIDGPAPEKQQTYEPVLAVYRDEMNFIGERSSGTTVYWAFIAILLHWLGRLSYWDGWNWSSILFCIYSVNIGVLLWASIRLQRTATILRKAVTSRLEPLVKPHPSSVPAIWEDIMNCNKGAFAPWHRQPIIGALMVALGGLGSVDLVTKLGAFINH